MSCTEVVAFRKKDGKAEYFGDVGNAWRGGFRVWTIMNDKYLGGKANVLFDPRPIFALYKDAKIDRVDRIVLGATFDTVIVSKDTLEETIKAFREFASKNEGTSLDEQADMLKDILEDEDYIAVAFNQTSVCENRWIKTSYDESGEERDESYDCINEKNHFLLIEDINKMEGEGFNGN